jgi:RNA polymerase sigma factor (sigma-70 family)
VTVALALTQPLGLPDSEAISASVDSPAAFATVFERHHTVVHRYLARRLGTDLADELAAEVFAVAFAKRSRYDVTVQNARPWLFGIATKLVQRHARREVRELRAYARTGVDPAAPAHDDMVAAQADSAALAPAVASAMAALPSEERDVLLLYAWAELPYPDIASALSVPVGTVKSRMNRARRRLRASLTDQGQLDVSRSAANG